MVNFYRIFYNWPKLNKEFVAKPTENTKYFNL